MEGQGETGSKRRSVEIEGQVETGSERRTRRRCAACSENHDEIRSERDDIAAEGALPIVPENKQAIGEAIDLANNDEIQELQVTLVLEELSSVPRNALSIVTQNLLGIDEANDNQTREAIQEDGPANQQHLEFTETNDDESDSDYDYETESDSEIAEILATDDFDTGSLNEEVAERLATDFPHLIAEQSAERQNTEEVLRRHIGRRRQLRTAYDADQEVFNELRAMGERHRRSLGMDTGPENQEGMWHEMLIEVLDLADDALTERYLATDRRLSALSELWRESNREVEALTGRRRIEAELRTISISEHHINNNTITSSCSICQIDFKLDEEASQVECGHLYHRPCISEWLGSNNTCPVCRFQMQNAGRF